MKKNLIIFGTRPEAIKMAPLVKEFLNNKNFETKVCVTAQHREMLDQVLEFYEIKPDYDLDLMKAGQSLNGLTARIFEKLNPVLEEFKPDYVYVHGDTTTSMAAGIAGFYAGAKVCHIEAGLRTFDKQSPFPEEMNRCVTGSVADYHFAPTSTSKNNLLNENVKENTILVTGNTVIDALNLSIDKLEGYQSDELTELKSKIDFTKKVLLVTGHRRENHGQGFINITKALIKIAKNNDVEIVYPVHLNPKVLKPVHDALGDVENIKLIQPLSYPSFVWLMNKSEIIITDSGGVQEEAPSLGKPVLVMRDTTERPEAVDAGTVILVGIDTEKIILETEKLLNNKEQYNKMSQLHNPYGDGKASKRIVEFIEKL